MLGAEVCHTRGVCGSTCCTPKRNRATEEAELRRPGPPYPSLASRLDDVEAAQPPTPTAASVTVSARRQRSAGAASANAAGSESLDSIVAMPHHVQHG